MPKQIAAAPEVETTLVDSWVLSLRAERKSAATLKSYGDGIRRFTAWCEAEGRAPLLDRSTVNGFVAALLEEGLEPATVRSRQLALRRFSAWLVEEGEADADRLLGIKPPKLDTKVTPSLTDDDLRALLKACATNDLWGRRDEAIIRFMAETGARAGEVVALGLDDVDLSSGIATVRRGKGGKGRTVPFGAQTGRSIDRYVRARRAHPRADSPALWLGARQGRAFGYDALHKTLKLRADQAGIVGFHPHVLRHTAAARWLSAGGSEGGLMAVAGWSRRDMIDRYVAATAADRAAAEASRLNLGDL